MSESSLIRSEATAVPAGRLCTWTGLDGATVTSQSGRGITVAAVIASMIAAVVIAARVRLRPKGLTMAMTALIVAPWVIIVVKGIAY